MNTAQLASILRNQIKNMQHAERKGMPTIAEGCRERVKTISAQLCDFLGL